MREKRPGCRSRLCGGQRHGRPLRACRNFGLRAGFTVLLVLAIHGSRTAAQPLVEGEFGDIHLDRELISPARFPTLTELWQLVREPEIRLALMFKLHGDGEYHQHLPIWSEDGQRLAFQRRKLGLDTSQIGLFHTLSQPEPELLSQEVDTYDYMFRWGVNGRSGFVFARIQARSGSTQVLFSPDGSAVETRTQGREQCSYPALYERTDGIHWLAYEHRGELILQAWNDKQRDEQVLTTGTTPRWSRDGRRLLIARQREGPLSYSDVFIRSLRDGSEIQLATGQHNLVRSPVWSPDETHVAWFQRDSREDSRWHIEVRKVAGDEPARVVLSQVLLNANYKSEGPSWEPSGRRVWCFSHDHRQQEYYPLVGAQIDNGATVLVDYPKERTAPNDLAVNPATRVPELAFTARDRTQQDLYIVLLNHY